MTGIRVLITDEHMIIREGLRMILDEYSDIQVVGEAENGSQAIELVEGTQPDVILMDLQTPASDGLAALTRIKSAWPQIAVVLLMSYSDDEFVLHGLQAGAQGFLFKDTNRAALLNTIRAAHHGDTLVKSHMLNRLLPKVSMSSALPAPNYPNPESESHTRISLSQRESEILKLVATGARNKEIAFQLKISQSTVKTHLDSIFNKLGVDSRTAAVSVASQLGLLITPIFLSRN